MNLDITISFKNPLQVTFPHSGTDVLVKINTKLEKLTMTVDEAIQAVKDVATQLGKAKDEILAKIAALESAPGADLSTEQQAAVDGLKSSAQALDDIVADIVPDPDPEPEPTPPTP